MSMESYTLIHKQRGGDNTRKLYGISKAEGRGLEGVKWLTGGVKTGEMKR